MNILAPLPYSNQEPEDDLDAALALLTIAGISLEDGRTLNAHDTHDMLVLIDEVRFKLQPILRFLRNFDAPGAQAAYRKARIEELGGSA